MEVCCIVQSKTEIYWSISNFRSVTVAFPHLRQYIWFPPAWYSQHFSISSFASYRSFWQLYLNYPSGPDIKSHSIPNQPACYHSNNPRKLGQPEDWIPGKSIAPHNHRQRVPTPWHIDQWACEHLKSRSCVLLCPSLRLRHQHSLSLTCVSSCFCLLWRPCAWKIGTRSTCQLRQVCYTPCCNIPHKRSHA